MMFSKNYFIVFILTFLVAGFIFMALPNTAKSGVAIPMGCCLQNGNQCPQCGVGNGEFCMSPDTDNAPPGQQCTNGFVEGEFCLRVPGADVCEPNVCCAIDDVCQQVPESLCEAPDFVGFGDCGQFPECLPDPPTLCCYETTSGDACQDGLTAEECATAGGTPHSGLTCEQGSCGGTPPPPVAGCCQFDGECSNANDQVCGNEGGIPVNGGECNVEAGFCNFSPEGCCVLGPLDCIFTTAEACEGDYQGNDSTCDIKICTTVISPIPTLNQWGLIAMAGLLGLFSLFIIIRRRRYNVG